MIVATVPSILGFSWTFPTPVRSIEFVVDLHLPVTENSLVALVTAPENTRVTSEVWAFSNQLQGNYKYVAAGEPGALVLPSLTFSEFVTEVTLEIVPWGPKDLAPASAIASVWAIADSEKSGAVVLNIISKGRLISND